MSGQPGAPMFVRVVASGQHGVPRPYFINVAHISRVVLRDEAQNQLEVVLLGTVALTHDVAAGERLTVVAEDAAKLLQFLDRHTEVL